MLTIKMFDVVRLKDGREGTIVEIYSPSDYEIEISGTKMDLETISIDKIAEIIS